VSTTQAPRAGEPIKVQKALVSSAVGADVAEVLAWYGLRWQVEIHQSDYPSNNILYRARPTGYLGGQGPAGTGTLVPAAARVPTRKSRMSRPRQRRHPPPPGRITPAA